MNVRLYVVVILCCLFTGCASPFQATWYLVPTGNSSEMYVAIFNQSNQQQNVTNVILNQPKDKKDSGWKSSNASAITLEPGELLIKRAADFINGSENFTCRCRVPVSVIVMTEQDKSGTKAEMAGRMPSLLPEGWEGCPDLEKVKH